MNESTAPGTGVTEAQRKQAIAQQATPRGEHELAWDLLEHSRSCLSVTELNTAFIKLGCGEYTAAIETVLAAVARAGATIPAKLTDRLTCWVAAYDGHDRHPRLRELMHRNCVYTVAHSDNSDA